MRYVIVDGSQSCHCCFDCTIVDTSKPEIIGGEHYVGRNGKPQYESVCECFNIGHAKMVCDALNASDEIHRLRAALAEAQRDAERYRFLQRRVCVVGTEALCGVRMKAAKFDFVNLPKLSEVPGNAARALDAAIDAAILATKEGRSNG